jgi:hypothetical protein
MEFQPRNSLRGMEASEYKLDAGSPHGRIAGGIHLKGLVPDGRDLADDCLIGT